MSQGLWRTHTGTPQMYQHANSSLKFLFNLNMPHIYFRVLPTRPLKCETGVNCDLFFWYKTLFLLSRYDTRVSESCPFRPKERSYFGKKGTASYKCSYPLHANHSHVSMLQINRCSGLQLKEIKINMALFKIVKESIKDNCQQIRVEFTSAGTWNTVLTSWPYGFFSYNAWSTYRICCHKMQLSLLLGWHWNN